MNNRKSLLFAYVFSLVGGLIGLHHLYLDRSQHALLWATTFGGFGIGFIYEFLFLIKKYVQEANYDRFILNQYMLEMTRKKSPAFEISRLCGQYLTAAFYGFITYYAFPDTWHESALLSVFAGCCSVFAIAVGTQIVGTIGPRRCSFIWPLLGALLGIPFIIWRIDSSPSFNISAILSSLIFECKLEWNPTYITNLIDSKSTEHKLSVSSSHRRRKRGLVIKRCLIFGLGLILFSAIFTSAIYHNLQVHIAGRRVRIKGVLEEYFQTQDAQVLHEKLSSILRELWAFYLQDGLRGIQTRIWLIFNFGTDTQAFRTLNLSTMASQKDIESQCRTLSRQWHPDRYQDLEQKQKVEVIFMNIRQACDHLSNERKRRQPIHE